ncbi:hypothetical protein [Wenjunlia tyrosinilytica]|uniref:Uncharacterized protein n=1 Tax=Wenjunlia tyrosinilytica TaxID=1544741 RepID=A0A917ZW86_9ACTN|nr:hypothetical protein [Wenjunlia tyrosinilytica]GGO95109.1 hypothetical protein GCM10012280_51570 [Wenjunlia tyrosinilytica]
MAVNDGHHDAVALLRRRGAEDAHPGGTLPAHLLGLFTRTHDLLTAEAREDCRAVLG